jgi:hypothetical protein
MARRADRAARAGAPQEQSEVPVETVVVVVTAGKPTVVVWTV